MSKRRGIGVIVSVTAASLLFAGSAFGALSPTFAANTQTRGTMISYSQGASDDALATVAFYAPTGYAGLITAAAGTYIGSMTAGLIAADLGSSKLALKGNIQIQSAATSVSYGGSTTTLGAVALTCTGTGTHDGFWVANLSGGGQTLQVPIFVDDIPIVNPLSPYSTDRITLCMAAPDLPAGTAGRAAAGAKLVSARLSLGNFSVPEGWYLWHAVATPYAAGTGKANAAAAVEIESLDRTPQVVTAKAVAGPAGGANVSGKVLVGGKGFTGATVTVMSGTKEIGSGKTSSGGRFAVKASSGGTLKVMVSFAGSSGRCEQAIFASLQCVSKSDPPFTAPAVFVRVTR